MPREIIERHHRLHVEDILFVDVVDVRHHRANLLPVLVVAHSTQNNNSNNHHEDSDCLCCLPFGHFGLYVACLSGQALGDWVRFYGRSSRMAP
jgi:hypothetical protein